MANITESPKRKITIENVSIFGVRIVSILSSMGWGATAYHMSNVYNNGKPPEVILLEKGIPSVYLAANELTSRPPLRIGGITISEQLPSPDRANEHIDKALQTFHPSKPTYTQLEAAKNDIESGDKEKIKQVREALFELGDTLQSENIRYLKEYDRLPTTTTLRSKMKTALLGCLANLAFSVCLPYYLSNKKT